MDQFPIQTKFQLISRIKEKYSTLDHRKDFIGNFNNINVNRYYLTQYSIDNLDTSSQSIIRFCIDQLTDPSTKNSKIYLSYPLNINFLKYELECAILAGYCGKIKSVSLYTDNPNDKTIYLVTSEDYVIDGYKTIIVTDTYVSIKY